MRSDLSCAVLASLICILPGCTSLHSSIQSTGEGILGFLGLAPVTESLALGNSIIEATSGFSKEEEHYFGRSVAAQILGRYELIRDRELALYLNDVGLVVASWSDMPETFGGYHFVALDTPEINAMAAPGGIVFITRGLLELLPDEDSLAAIFAHEISHVAERHGMQAISQDNLQEALLSVGRVAGSSLACGDLLNEAKTVFGRAVEDISSTLLSRGYDREQEFDADRMAVTILQRAGYNPKRLLLVLDLLGQAEKEAQDTNSGWFSTHPSPQDRLNALSEISLEELLPAEEQLVEDRKQRFLAALEEIGYAGAA
jgi:predicted Zn-dependent protease